MEGLLGNKDIPENSGVYIFKNIENKILYIGKAKNLRKRISSYFQKNHTDLKTSLLVKKIKKIEWIITNNEVEALILENNLIKKHKPPFNIKLADDKTYPYLKVDLTEPFPKLTITRKKHSDRAIYFGPYPSAYSLKNTLNFIQKNFKLRKCNDKKFKNRLRPCLNYQINLCSAPCCNKITEKEYKEIFNSVLMFLQGKTNELIDQLKDKMLKFSEELKFEEAAKIRDIIINIEKFVENQQQSVELSEIIDTDVFVWKLYEEKLYFNVLKVKKGKVIDSEFYYFDNVAIFEESPLIDFISRYYSIRKIFPEKIVVNERGIKRILEKFILKEFNKKVEIVIAKNNKIFLDLIKFSEKNLEAKIKYKTEYENIFEKIKKRLKLKNIPYRIDAFDISTFRGKKSVGVRITFIKGKEEKKYYRMYNIKTIDENKLNDFAMIYEIVNRSVREYIKTNDFPQLLLIDGGKGQLNYAFKVLKENCLENKIDIISIAKDKMDNIDKIYLVNRKNYVDIQKDKDIIYFLMKIRDEAHRFAVKFHHKKDENEKFISLLRQIKGVGEKRAKLLLKEFKSIEKIKNLSIKELEILPFIDKKLAERIYEFFKYNYN